MTISKAKGDFMKWMALIFILASVLGCDEKKAPERKTTGNKEPVAPGVNKPGVLDPTSSTTLCGKLEKHSIKAQFAKLIETICADSGISKVNFYRGTGDPELQRKDLQNGSKTHSMVMGGYQTESDPVSVFNLMLVMISKPDEFSKQGFESDSHVTYTSSITNSQTVEYTYMNNKHNESVVEYKADSVFYKVDDKTYFITTELKQILQTLSMLKGSSGHFC
jgi:hypothetical protein